MVSFIKKGEEMTEAQRIWILINESQRDGYHKALDDINNIICEMKQDTFKPNNNLVIVVEGKVYLQEAGFRERLLK